MIQHTTGSLLGGRLRYAQPAQGYRTALEPVLLAASIPARPRQRVLEAGTGAGAGLLCLAARVPGVRGLGLERDAEMAALARRNVDDNGFADAIAIEVADVLAYRATDAFDHAFANPPWHDGHGTSSPTPALEAAKRAPLEGIARWISALASALRHGGTLSLILPLHRLPECLAGLEASRCARTSLVPLWPRLGREAKLVIVRSIRGGNGPCRLLPGLVLHAEEGPRFTPEADALLRAGKALEAV